MRIIRRFKKATATLLAVGMVVSGLPSGVLDAKAATTILQPNASLEDTSSGAVSRVGDYTFGSTDATAYAFGPMYDSTNGFPFEGRFNNWNAHGVNTGVNDLKAFNISAVLQASDRTNNTKGYLDTNYTAGQYLDPPKVITAFYPYGNQQYNWWNTYYGFGTYRSDYSRSNPAVDGSEPNAVDPGVTSYSSSGEPLTSTLYGANVQFPPTATLNGRFNFFNPEKNGGVKVIDEHGHKVEVRQEVKPSDDGEYILVRYTVYNAGNNTVDFVIGNESDTQLYNHDSCPIIVNDSDKLHMIANAGNTYEYSTFDLRAEGRDARVWAGQWSTNAGLIHSAWAFAKEKDQFIQDIDSAAGFSAHFHLAKGEADSATFYLQMKTSVYYVDPSFTGTSTGYLATPYKTIQDAINAISGNHPHRSVGSRDRKSVV